MESSRNSPKLPRCRSWSWSTASFLPSWHVKHSLATGDRLKMLSYYNYLEETPMTTMDTLCQYGMKFGEWLWNHTAAVDPVLTTWVLIVAVVLMYAYIGYHMFKGYRG